ncbi:unnamed protein product [Cuscuta epithymum]|uniref:Uncharacterized protein n=1 Tax=Cuscuta epithymum TaxID=186058 RepID=A0AAV0E5I5_9ASTE|nr:unnamed protein product [Cuscuta epithymum]
MHHRSSIYHPVPIYIYIYIPASGRSISQRNWKKKIELIMTKGSLLKKMKRLVYRGGRRAAVASSSAEAAAEKWRAEEKRRRIPSDVPKGHLAVYVGERQKRFVIKLTTLKHPLFISLLDETAAELQDEYEYEYDDSKFWIPCDESIFVSVIRCATPPPTKLFSICIC